RMGCQMHFPPVSRHRAPLQRGHARPGVINPTVGAITGSKLSGGSVGWRLRISNREIERSGRAAVANRTRIVERNLRLARTAPQSRHRAEQQIGLLLVVLLQSVCPFSALIGRLAIA